MSIIRRIPKRGFNNKEFKTRFELIHLSDLAKHFEAGQTVDEAALRAKGLLRRHYLLKLLGDGALDRKLTIRVHAASESAREKVAKAGGTIELIATKEIEVKKKLSPDAQGKKGAKGETKPAAAPSKPKGDKPGPQPK